MPTGRVSRSVVALAASAITAVYAAGYVHTSAADTALASSSSSAATLTDPAQPGAAPPVTTTAAAPTATSTSSSALKDGTYTGTGSSRRGDVKISMSVQGGRISAVNITGATTQYPTRFIANLPGEVVSRQSARVDVISGATDSSLAFRGAVLQALQHAQN